MSLLQYIQSRINEAIELNGKSCFGVIGFRLAFIGYYNKIM